MAVDDITGVLGGILFEVCIHPFLRSFVRLFTDGTPICLHAGVQVTKEKNEARVQRFLAVTRERILVLKQPDSATEEAVEAEETDKDKDAGMQDQVSEQRSRALDS